MRLVIAMLAPAAIAFAQDGTPRDEKPEAVPAAPIVAPPEEARPDAAPTYQELLDGYNAAQRAFYDEWRKAREKDATARLDQSEHPRHEYKAKFEAFAKRAAGTDAAVPAWVMFMRCGGDAEAVRATLLKDHIGSEKLVDALYSYSYGEPEVLEEFARKSPHRSVKGVAYLLLGANLLRQNKSDEAANYLVMCQWRYADVPLYRGRTTVGEKATSCLFEARNLAIGQTVPEIEGEDTDGVVFKLSDYRGKVVVLDFWGDW